MIIFRTIVRFLFCLFGIALGSESIDFLDSLCTWYSDAADPSHAKQSHILVTQTPYTIKEIFVKEDQIVAPGDAILQVVLCDGEELGLKLPTLGPVQSGMLQKIITIEVREGKEVAPGERLLVSEDKLVAKL